MTCIFFHGNNMLFYQKQCKKVLRVHKTLSFNRNSCFHLLNLPQGRIRSVLFTLFKSLYLLVHYYVYHAVNKYYTPVRLVGSHNHFSDNWIRDVWFSSEMFAPRKVFVIPKCYLSPSLQQNSFRSHLYVSEKC